MTKYIFDNLHEIKYRLQGKEKILLFLDYDGTLVSFKKKPDQVKTPEKIKNILKKISDKSCFKPVIITGRTLEEIKKLIDIDDFVYAAVHGLKIKYPDKQEFIWEKAEKNKPILKKIKKQTHEEFIDEEDVFIEDKKLTVAFHYRTLSEEKINDIVKKFVSIIKKYDKKNELNILHGSKVVEVRPRGWDKGKAVETIIENFDNKNFLPVYLGDDTTDEDAFRFLKNKGLTVYVINNSEEDTDADYYLKNPDDVYGFLEKMYDWGLKLFKQDSY